MRFDEYVASLRTADADDAYINADRDGEIAYLEKAASRFEQVFQAIPSSARALRILDIGTTPFTFFIKHAYPGYEVWTMDRTGLMETRCTAHDVHFRTCDLDAQAMPFEDDYFDIVIFTEVLEHVFRPPTEVLQETRRILREGGTLVLGVPNFAILYHRVKLLFGITPLQNPDRQMKKSWVHGHGHLHEYTMKEITAILSACGFTITRRRFLRRGIGEAFQNPKENIARKLIRAASYVLMVLIPSCGPIVYVECRK